MGKLPAKACDRIVAGLKRFQPILQSAKSRDVNESDTVVIVTDLLQDVFGYDKYTELTSEYAIKSSVCDLAIKLDGKLAFLIEVKAIGLELKEQHVRQAVDYAANQGCEWVALTNGAQWRVFRVTLAKAIETEQVVEIDLLAVNPRDAEPIEMIGLIAKEGWQKQFLDDYYSQVQALSRFTLGALLLTDPVLDIMRREIRRISPSVRVDTDQIKAVLESGVIKREVLEGEKADQARRQVSRAANKSLRNSKTEAPAGEDSGAKKDPAAPPDAGSVPAPAGG